jgi:uncharacterized metal-binding protein
MKKKLKYTECALCDDKSCYTDGLNCTKHKNSNELKENHTFLVSSNIEADFYMHLCRLEELLVFCNRMKVNKIGIAFCIGLAHEAKILCELLKEKGLEVYSVCCKIGGVSKESLSLHKIRPEQKESNCNPLLQAHILNDCNTDLNVLVGLCMGHDIEFTKHSDAPVTTFIVKDRILAHNPVGALYSNYYRKKIARVDYNK